MAKWRRPNSPSFRPTPPDRRAALNASKARARQLLDRGQIDEALPHLQQLVIDYPDDADLQMMFAMCLFAAGDPDTALIHYERAYALDKNPAVLLPLGLAYLRLAMYGRALHAFTESNRRGLPLPDAMLPALTQLRQDVGAMADAMHLPLEKAIVGLREMEQGTRWLDRNDFPRAIEANRAAIKVLGAWPPPHNNLALALFFDGQPAAAIAECRQVLAREPENLMAAGNLVRFLAWSGERVGAEESWRSLSTRSPIDLPADALKLAEAAAVMDDDESVRRLLLPLADWSPDEIGGWRQYVQVQQFLATADANLGDPKAIAPGQRLTGLRKAELQQLVVETLLDPATLEDLATGRLSAAECAALAAVLAAGGAMPQQQFRATYGDDAAESPWWQYALPTSVAGRLRLQCLLVEATVAGEVYLAIPAELRGPLATALTVQ